MSEDRTILLIGSGPIQIGQAAEFDYPGTGVPRPSGGGRSRRPGELEPGDDHDRPPETADRVYIEPITPEAIRKSSGSRSPTASSPDSAARPDRAQRHRRTRGGGNFGGVRRRGDGDAARHHLRDGGPRPVPPADGGSGPAGSRLDDHLARRGRVGHRLRRGGLPRARPPSTRSAGSPLSPGRRTPSAAPAPASSTTSRNWSNASARGSLSRNSEVLITESIAGWVELEYEVMRDADDSCIIICNMENIDPMGIHTGESTVVVTPQVIPDDGHQEMRDAALEVIRDLGIQGGCNIQFAWHDDGTPGGEYRVVEVNPRVSPPPRSRRRRRPATRSLASPRRSRWASGSPRSTTRSPARPLPPSSPPSTT